MYIATSCNDTESVTSDMQNTKLTEAEAPRIIYKFAEKYFFKDLWDITSKQVKRFICDCKMSNRRNSNAFAYYNNC